MKLLLSSAFLGTAIASFTPLAANAVSISFTSTLDGAQEVRNPPVVTSATGSATGILSGTPGHWVFTYTLTYSGLSSGVLPGVAHIHNAAKGANGPVVHELDNITAGSTSDTITGDWRFDDPNRPLTDELAQALKNGNTYFNIHTATFPSGEIRGQIEPVPEPTLGLGTLVLGVAGAKWKLQQRKQKQKLAS